MRRSRRPGPLPALLSALLLALGPCGDALAQRQGDPRQGGDQRDRDRAQQEQPRLSAREAAAIAQSRHGGKVLKVTRKGGAYRVKLLLDSGRVTTVTIRE
ncbi:PepSY domain-containing protein [Parahaliea mediterranea]|uniref:PepSY domain-containing protein n=1 Tax=Parahaliea mediterranea TaxID=651086 RepID=A0A939DGT0_9GAMM|nr:PepSY domain-containing protein [Parahaliea mediterranea]MBN7797845.1 PepSY domain-containing protein [Parahaliea mediterranea]